MSTSKNRHSLKNKSNDLLKKLQESTGNAGVENIETAIDPKDNIENEETYIKSDIKIQGEVVSDDETAADEKKEPVKTAIEEKESIYDKYIGFNGTGQIVNVPLKVLVPAPIEWNFYSPLSQTKMLELMDSITEKGLLHPIVVWERENGEFMILSGHNRVKAYTELSQATGDNQYKEIRALVKRKDEITAEEAQSIIIDTNWISRQLSPLEKSQSIFKKYTTIMTNTQRAWNTGRLRDKISEQFKISGRRIDQYMKLNFLIEEFKSLIENGKLSIKAGSKIASLSAETQKWLYDTYKEHFTNKILEKITTDMVQKEIAALFQYEVNLPIKLSLKIQEQDKEKVKELISKALKDNEIYMEWTI